jgi:predicted ferric reductase
MSQRTLLLFKLAYLGVAAVPLAVAFAGHPRPGRGFAVEFAVGLGFVGFGVLALQFAVTGRFQWYSRVLGLDTLLHFHRQIALVAYGFILAHLGILVAASPVYAAFLDPRVEPLRALALWVVIAALTAIIVTTLWRRQLGIPYQWWLTGHALLALAIVFIGLVHILRVGWYVAQPWKQAVWVGATLLAFGLLLHSRLYQPLRLRRRPWRVTEVRRERGESWTLRLQADGHAGMPFRAGQFVWLTLGPSPFSLDQHPFSISSSAARPEEVELTVKELGDFTAEVGRVEPGTVAFLDGPYGGFVPDDEAGGIVCVAGGIGITPIMSILRTLRDRPDPAPTVLVYGAASVEDATFLSELEEMGREPWLDLTVVLEAPPEGWEGEVGRVTPDVLARHLPPDRPDLQYLVCGPDPMQDGTEAFLSDRGVPVDRVRSERFNIA